MTEKGPMGNQAAAGEISIVTYHAIDPTQVGPPKDPDEDEDTTLSPVGDLVRGILRHKTTVTPESFQEKLSTFLKSMNTALGGIPSLLGAYKVDEIELSLEVGAEGELSLLGTGGKLTGTSGITLTLKHTE